MCNVNVVICKYNKSFLPYNFFSFLEGIGVALATHWLCHCLIFKNATQKLPAAGLRELATTNTKSPRSSPTLAAEATANERDGETSELKSSTQK